MFFMKVHLGTCSLMNLNKFTYRYFFNIFVGVHSYELIFLGDLPTIID